MSVKHKDFPLDEIADIVTEFIDNGWTIYQKFSCEKCGQRLTMEEPNRLFTHGTCDKCGHKTDLRKRGCNYLAVSPQGYSKPTRGH